MTGGTIWEKAAHDSKGQMTPVMYRIEYEGKPYLEPVKKFAVSRDGMIAALVMHNNQILTYKVRIQSIFSLINVLILPLFL